MNRIVLSALILACALATGRAIAAEEAKVLFKASFDYSAIPDEAEGAREATTSEGVKLVPARNGKGLYIGQGERCIYQREGNLLAESGTIHFWWSPGRDLVFKRKPDDDRTLLRINNEKRRGIILYIDNGTQPKCILLGDKDVYLDPEKHMSWKKGEWHHFALTWGNGNAALYIDGELASGKKLGSKPAVGKTILLGFRKSGSKSIECADGTFDDLVIMDKPLSAEQVAAIAKKKVAQ
jgi:Concanavalin A-like lectin/glucanases superfamily